MFKKFFKKKNESTSTDNIKDFALRNLSEITAFNATLKGEELFLNEHNIKIYITIHEVTQIGGGYSACLNFVLQKAAENKPCIIEEFHQMVAGMGANVNQAICHVVANFESTCMEALNSMLLDSNKLCKFDTDTNSFNVYGGNTLITSFSPTAQNITLENGELFDIIKPKLNDYLNNSNVSWINIFCVSNGIKEVRINSVIIPELSDMLDKFISKYEQEPFISFKNTYLLKSEKPNLFPYSKQEVEKYIDQSIEIFNDERLNPSADDDTIDTLNNIIKDEALSTELISWIPEILAEMLMSEVTFLDTMILATPTEQIQVKKSKFTHYYWVYHYLENLFNNRKLDKDCLLYLIARSASFKTMNDALNNGSNPGNLLSVTAYFVPENYIVR
ncbi:hypothetical protein AN639_07445 [Candidatus Epulonipiscium fishelsonii]|uniref:Uncharacterized protein n=1 Tax=Candidatus Epulonipiscium fishelsonii TaxID=77094 RepID=A0ACC8XF13_9FIRM|nr:hypothetical protein AN639_07445 [Epulopiscium sp. SCG-B05WGA-EpuloA1]ONI41903.1 hypothetical protein AN396_02925 [Epulopiscium sp. SCG-B11WGA-EpuloA1]